MLAPVKWSRSVVENAEPAAGNNWRHIAAAEAEGTVRPKGRIGQQMRDVAVRINRVDGQVIRENGVVRRKRRRDQFVKPNAGPHQAPIQAPNKPGGVTHVRAVQQGGLLHRTADLPDPRKFGEVSHAASKLLFEGIATGCAGATTRQKGHNRAGCQKSEWVL